MKRSLVLLIALGLVSAACSSTSAEPKLVGIRASTDTAVGDQRFLFAVSEIDGRRRGSPDEKVTIVATSLDAPDVEIATDTEFLWVIPDAFGLYLANIPFDRPGLWEIDFEVSTGEETTPFLVDVLDAPTTIASGDSAPLIATPTSNDVPLEDLTTDNDPMPALYEISLDEAFSNGQQSVVIFATPAFCTSAACGPLLKQTKVAAAEFQDVNFVHIEVYSGFNEEGFQPDTDHLVPAVEAFRLPSEPWIFVIDENGVVKSRLEGVLADGELEEVLDS